MLNILKQISEKSKQITRSSKRKLLKKIENLETRAMHGQLPLIWDRAEGFQVYDKWGNIWLDFTSTIFVANSGHANKRIISGLKKLLEKPLLHTYTYLSTERLDYLDY